MEWSVIYPDVGALHNTKKTRRKKMSETITVRSGINSMTIELQGRETVSDILSRTRSILNIEGEDNLRVVVDGEGHDYVDVSDHIVEEGSVLEFVKRAGSKA